MDGVGGGLDKSVGSGGGAKSAEMDAYLDGGVVMSRYRFTSGRWKGGVGWDIRRGCEEVEYAFLGFYPALKR